MDIEAVTKALAAAAAQIDGVNAYDGFPLSVSTPAFVIANVEATITGYCAEQLEVTCGLLVGKVDDAAARGHLYEYATAATAGGDKSLLQALEADPTLGGLCNDVTVTSRRLPRVLPVGATEYLAAEVVVQVDGGM